MIHDDSFPVTLGCRWVDLSSVQGVFEALNVEAVGLLEEQVVVEFVTKHLIVNVFLGKARGDSGFQTIRGG